MSRQMEPGKYGRKGAPGRPPPTTARLGGARTLRMYCGSTSSTTPIPHDCVTLPSPASLAYRPISRRTCLCMAYPRRAARNARLPPTALTPCVARLSPNVPPYLHLLSSPSCRTFRKRDLRRSRACIAYPRRLSASSATTPCACTPSASRASLASMTRSKFPSALRHRLLFLNYRLRISTLSRGNRATLRTDIAATALSFLVNRTAHRPPACLSLCPLVHRLSRFAQHAYVELSHLE
ncbi:hypothetical protein HYPSUDRAFT_215219 [Hypholoma sublateritium FD-334 SS-4]|uniref:Uncharacterized protein n=1 Tax=Hypholoma sublateritium (strain FD-334 SS-4) TaxID=945553 RepID=A0A0D2NXB8_HYPSF|nr:hypothetical protein HYPSUDRAFT_215219 [Hypholoma sublateritium FD-334 SS-4]